MSNITNLADEKAETEILERIESFSQSVDVSPCVCCCHDLFNALQSNEVVLDIRSVSDFCCGHILGSYHLTISNTSRPKSIEDLISNDKQREHYVEVAHLTHKFWIIADNTKSNKTIEEDILVFVTCIKKLDNNCNVKMLDSFHSFQSSYPFLIESLTKEVLEELPAPSKIPHYPNAILPNQLYLGDMDSCSQGYIFKDLCLTHVLNVAAAHVANHFEDMSILPDKVITKMSKSALQYLQTNKITYYSVAIDDLEDIDIKKHFGKVLDFIGVLDCFCVNLFY
ncbi:hypothetical protein RFI_21961 [Reticulomyxa filosa]|uniref:Rhodanese domain-containing protein n=1 Tax=Reticulomyxa filosa TaxID=46433 RepID=X6MQR3_RETFI|nr:hypothetical protein RFI_21961 [Reticulomyxa filosa]|eukprot:ETO15405.1 hypothetical protein RFI_21961 [Reticulomyxa filosa]